MNIAISFRRHSSVAVALIVFVLCGRPAIASLTVSTTNQQGQLPFTPTWAPLAGNLISGMLPTGTNGDYSKETAGRIVQSLTSGGSLTISGLSGNTTSTNYLTCGNSFGAGSLLVYTLPATANGFDLTNIIVYGGWKDNGRDQEAYTVSYSTAANPSQFVTLTSVNYNPSVPSGTASATRVSIADAGGSALASNVVSVKFDFTNPTCENGYCGYAAIEMYGTASSPPTGPPFTKAPDENPTSAATGIPAGTIVTLGASATGAAPISYQWRTDGGSGGAMTNISGETAASLVINTTGYSLGTYRFDYVASNSIGVDVSPAVDVAVVSMTDIGISAPTPGLLDISQLLNTVQEDDGLNYYTDNGPVYGKWCGQTFTTGNNPAGYLLTSFAWKSSGNGSGFGILQPYNLFFFSLSPDGSQATLLSRYKINGSGTEGDWLQWQGLNVPMAANQTYAYTFGRDEAGSGWEHIGTEGGNPYASGQIITLSHTNGTGAVTRGIAGNSDAVFNLGFASYEAATARAIQPIVASGNWPVYAGDSGNFTLQENPLGTGPFTYQWLSDSGTGGALRPVSQATSSNLTVNMANLAAGNYNYAVIVSNASGASLSPSFAVSLLGPTAPAIVTNITPAPANCVNVGQSASFSAAFVGTAPINYQWYFNNGFGPVPISNAENSSAGSNALTMANVQLADDGMYSVVAQNAAGSVTSSVSTLVVVPPTNSSPPAVTVPPVALQVSHSQGQMQLQWEQGILQHATNLTGPWVPLATNLEASMVTVPMTNAAAYFRSTVVRQPRIVNLYCFCRDQDFRIGNSQQILFNATTQQVQLFKQANLPATFALQHDALVDTNYENYFKSQLGTNCEIGAWWEITQTLVEGAGLTWRGDHEWVSTANIAFSPGYTPPERIKLVDKYMADFYARFGYYPKTVGSWYIDEVTLQYMRAQYGVIASANCKDQLGTDSYTMWGSYWNQAYYPSKLNSYMPAQTPGGQIDMPVFRLLGSDPIYQYGNYSSGIYTLEPVYSYSGGSPTWMAWYLNALIKQPSLAFGYTQAGQENAFGWDSMSAGLINQVALISAEAKAGNIQVLTMAQAGDWFRKNYSVTPPTSVVALDDFKQQGRKSVWYNSRFFRCNVLWDQGTFFIRDLHCFDETVTSSTHNIALTDPFFVYETLPVMDGGQWSGNGGFAAGMWLVSLPGETIMPVPTPPVVKELNSKNLSIVQPLGSGTVFAITFAETNITCIGTNALGQPLNWAWDLVGGSQQSAAVQNVTSNAISYNYIGAGYQIRLGAGSSSQLGNGNIRLMPDASGKLMLQLGGN